MWSIPFFTNKYPQGWYSECVNSYIPTQTPKEDWSDHMQSPGWPPNLCVAWCLIWWLKVFKKHGHTWHWMSFLRPFVIKQHKAKPNQTTNKYPFVSAYSSKCLKIKYTQIPKPWDSWVSHILDCSPESTSVYISLFRDHMHADIGVVLCAC